MGCFVVWCTFQHACSAASSFMGPSLASERRKYTEQVCIVLYPCAWTLCW
jgi:hypothetical protein